jgi:hypothetical protein
MQTNPFYSGPYEQARFPVSRQGLWKRGDKAPEGKYLVQRRDGTVPEWPNFVLGARDPAASTALRAYAAQCLRIDATRAVDTPETYGAQYIQDVRDLADEFDQYYSEHGKGDPSAPPHRKDDPAIIEKMKQARGS